jgi:uncharacterized protein YlzI (FlbEa/FlbD family)
MSWIEFERTNGIKTLLNVENIDTMEEAITDEDVAFTVIYMKSGKIELLPVPYDVIKKRIEECYTKMQVKVYEHDDVESVVFELGKKKQK